MRKRSLFLLFALFAAAALFVSGASVVHALHISPVSSHPPANLAAATSTHDNGGPELRGTTRISIPYGITSTLPLANAGQSVRVSGHGGCTDGEQVTVVVTVTQSSGAFARGEVEQACTGELQQWWTWAKTTDMPLVAGPAEACGRATTSDQYGTTDVFDWCRDLTLAWPSYLPIMVREFSP